MYLALPAVADLERISAVLPARAEVLDLGSGPGRIVNPLVSVGHTVTAVDDSPAMLAHVQRYPPSWVPADDAELASLAAASDLVVLRTLDEAGAWVLLGAGRLGAA